LKIGQNLTKLQRV